MAKKQPSGEEKVKLDLNNPTFQADLFALSKTEQALVLGSLRKIVGMTWPQVYADKGLRWERIISARPPEHLGIDAWYSFRVSRGRRVMAYRDNDFMRLLTLPPDHDAAYGKK